MVINYSTRKRAINAKHAKNFIKFLVWCKWFWLADSCAFENKRSFSLSAEGRNGYCCGCPAYSTWKTSSFIHDCKGKKNESPEAEVFVSLCFDIVTAHHLLKGRHTLLDGCAKFRGALLRDFGWWKMRASVTDNTLVACGGSPSNSYTKTHNLLI